MSTMVMAAVWPLQMPPTQKAVLVSLADNANDSGHCWPSITTICDRTCFGRTAVMAAIAWLEEHSALAADRSNGRHTTYVITPSVYNQSVSRTGPAEQPVRQANTASPAGGLDQSVSRTAPVRQADSNRKEPSRTVKSNQQGASLDLSCWPSTPSPEKLTAWLDVRKKKRAPVSPTVIEAMGKQLRLAAEVGWTVDECLAECAFRNWQALKAEWLTPKEKNHDNANRGAGRKLSAVEQVEQAIDERKRRESARAGAIEGSFTAVDSGSVLAADGSDVRPYLGEPVRRSA